MKHKYIYTLYMHTNLINNKKYIGITSLDVNNRWGYNGNKYKRQLFYCAIKKYGWNNFKHEIIFCNLSKEEAQMFEIELIKYYKTTDRKYGYNIHEGGSLGVPITDEIKRKISLANKGKKRTEEQKILNSILHKGRKHTEEAKNKISQTMKNKNINSGKSNPMYGKIPKNSKKVKCIETQKTFQTITETAIEMGLDFRLISAVCHKKRHTTGGYHFEFIYE